MLPCIALRLAAPNGVQSERTTNPVEVQTKHRSHSEGDSVKGRSAVRPSAASDWFEYSRSLVRQLLAIASAFSRSVADGLSKASRTLVEALSKDCRTSLEQQSNNCRRNTEASCVCTHAKVPARSGLGLALGLVVLLITAATCLEAYGQASVISYNKEATGYRDSLGSRIGTVLKAVTNLPLEGALVRLDGTSYVTFTDENGRFEIPGDTDSGTLSFSFNGYGSSKLDFKAGGFPKGASVVRLIKSLEDVVPLLVGDSIPDFLWDLPLEVVNHPLGRNTITLREYRHKKLIVLDFWARWCAPCVKSVNAWDTIQPLFPENLSVLGVHMDLTEKALPFIKERGWGLPSIVGENYHVLNRHFFNRYQVGAVVFIKDSCFYAAPDDKGHQAELLRRILADEEVHIINQQSSTYMERRGR